MNHDLIPQITVRKAAKVKTLTELIIIKQCSDTNPNFNKEQKQYVRGFVDALISIKHKFIFS